MFHEFISLQFLKAHSALIPYIIHNLVKNTHSWAQGYFLEKGPVGWVNCARDRANLNFSLFSRRLPSWHQHCGEPPLAQTLLQSAERQCAKVSERSSSHTSLIVHIKSVWIENIILNMHGECISSYPRHTSMFCWCMLLWLCCSGSCGIDEWLVIYQDVAVRVSD